MSRRLPLGPDSPRLIVIAACIAAGIFLAILATPNILLRMPTEWSRTTVTVRALQHAPAGLAMVVTGDSVAMNGINARLLGAQLQPPRETWNLSSPGQQLAESLFIADMLPRSVHTLIVGMLPYALTPETIGLSDERYLFYQISGYRPSADALDVARQLGQSSLFAMMSRPQWETTLSGRGLIRLSADLTIRSRLRRDLDLERARTDLYFPAPYHQQISEAALVHAINITYTQRTAFRPNMEATVFLRQLHELLARRGQRLVIVIMPEHPRSIALTSAAFYRQLAQYEERLREREHLEVIDLHDQLAETDFIDQAHPGASGSERLTRLISDSLRTQHFPS